MGITKAIKVVSISFLFTLGLFPLMGDQQKIMAGSLIGPNTGSNIIIGQGSKDQDRSTLAYSGSNYLAVWQEGAAEGPFGGTGSSDIKGQLINPDGTLINGKTNLKSGTTYWGRSVLGLPLSIIGWLVSCLIPYLVQIIPLWVMLQPWPSYQEVSLLIVLKPLFSLVIRQLY